ncbi:MAG TPA: fumarylacetoacetate hydrolase family protein [Stellaceae bacterium]|nr:fumarylacetoacetate hydrolase family protein [Stellaceae bacterium]
MNAAGAAQRLVEARRTGRLVAGLEGDLLPRDDADAYQVQEAAMRLLGVTQAGWKIGAPNPTAVPVAAPLFAALVRPSPARFSATASSFRAVEAELALALGRDLPARAAPYGEDEAWDAIAAVHVAIELLDSRYADRRAMPPAALLADQQSNGGFCYGPANPLAAADFLAARASLLFDGKVEKSAVGGNPVGHPKRLVVWLANHAASRGRALRKGDIVTTGSHTGITVAPIGARVTARFEGLGEAVMEIAAA